MTLPTDKQARKRMPIATGVLAYFPDAIAAVAGCSLAGKAQHAPDEPLRWIREKSSDHTDTIVRHLVDHMTADPIDADGVPHIVKVAWRALAEAQLFLEAQQAKPDKRAEAQEIVNRVNAAAERQKTPDCNLMADGTVLRYCRECDHYTERPCNHGR